MGGLGILQACPETARRPIPEPAARSAVVTTRYGFVLVIPRHRNNFVARTVQLAACRGTQRAAVRWACVGAYDAHHGLQPTEITMKSMKSVFACLAATGMLLAQPAAAASAVRSGSPTQDSEELAGVPGAAIPALIAILAVAIVAVISSSNDKDHPTSP